MRVQWYGQSAFCLDGEQMTVFIDPFGDVSGLAARGLKFEYPAIENVSAKFFREADLWVKTKTPVLVLKTDNEIPKE